MKSANDTKQKLINATREMIDNNGIQSISLREIGNKVQLSRSAIYRHFKSKEDLLSAIVLENFKMLKENICHLINQTDDPICVLVAVLKYYYNFGVNNQEHYSLMFCGEFKKELYPNVYHAAFELFEIVSNCIAKAQEQNRIINKSLKEIAAMSYAFVHGLVLLKFAGHDESEKGLDTPYDLIDSFLGMLAV